MSSEPFIFDPNDPDALLRLWCEDYNEWGDVGGNAWAVLTPERELIGIFTTDAGGAWIYGDTPDDGDGMATVIEAVRSIGGSDVIGIHFHPTTDPAGPCETLDSFCQMAKARMAEAGINLRFVIVGFTDGRVDGVVGFAKKPDEIVSQLVEGAQLRANFSADKNLTDEERALMLACLDNMMASLIGVAEPDIDLAAAAASLALDKMVGMGADTKEQHEMVNAIRAFATEKEPPPPPAPKKSVFDLPVIDPADVTWMN